MISIDARKIKSTLTRDILDDTAIVEKRIAWEEFATNVSIPDNVHVENLSISGVPCLLHTPVGDPGTDEVIVYVHGGGLVEGSVVTSREWCARLASAALRPVVSIDYRLAPEYPFPAAIDDVFAVCNNIQQQNTVASIFSIGADSSGCVLALQALISLRNQGSPLPSSCFFLSPSLDLTFSGRSMELNRELDLVVNKDVLEHYAQLYAGSRDMASPEISPLYADLKNLPPMLVHVDDDELLLDDATRLENTVKKSGGRVQLIITHGLWHAWPTWGDFPEARAATQQIVEHMQKPTTL